MLRQFSHAPEIWTDFPELAAGVVYLEGITAGQSVTGATDRFAEMARSRLDGATESELPEIQAWRRVFSRMGLKPTQYRCAAEALLRRFRKEGALPRIHPVIDLCNAVSIAYAVPVAVFDADKIADWLEVRRATGVETYETFSGETETPEPGEVIFADADGRAHARRWTNRQSAHSAVGQQTSRVLIVAEALHNSAATDVARLTAALADELETHWQVTPRLTVLSRARPEFGVS